MPNDLPDRAILEEIVHRIDPAARLIDARPLEGGISAQIIALDIVRDSGCQERLVLRRHGAWDLQQNPRIAAMEYALLRCLADRGLPVPEPLLLDESGTLLPTPWLVQTFLPGEPRWGVLHGQTAPLAELFTLVDGIARQMAAIHTVGADDPSLPALPDRLAVCQNDLAHPPERPDETLLEGEIRAALLATAPPVARNPRVLLHSDLWPGNILWQDGAVSGILDWSEASVGDPIADLGNTRLELLWAYGEPAMERFTAKYLALTGHDTAALPWWDLIAALKPCGNLSTWIGDPEREAVMAAAQRPFARRAIRQLEENGHGWTGWAG